MEAKRKTETSLRKNNRYEKTTRDVVMSCFCEEKQLHRVI